MTVRQPDPAPGAEPERGFIVGVFPRGVDGEAELSELRELARTAGVAPVGELVQHRAYPDPRTFVGKGKLTELKEEYGGSRAEVLRGRNVVRRTYSVACARAVAASNASGSTPSRSGTAKRRWVPVAVWIAEGASAEPL